MMQTGVYKWFKRTRGKEYADAHKVFRMAPLHHHFEKLGWEETTVVTRFYILGDSLRDGGAGHAQAPVSFERWKAGGREAAVVGLARSGMAAALLLRREGIPVYASDRRACRTSQSGPRACAGWKRPE